MSANITTVSVAQFLSDFPQFSNGTVYPESSIASYLLIAIASLDPGRWCQFWTQGVELWVAHYLTLDAIDKANAVNNGIMGQQSGQIASKSVGGVSINYDANASAEPTGGHWNLTTFGKRWLRFAQMAGMGGVQITGATTDQGAPLPGTSA